MRAAPIAALRPLGGIWGWAAKIRRELYEAGFFHSEKAPLPVVSVGNLTVGGNGKTPMCAFLAEALRARGFSPAILSRGYLRSRSLPDPLVVSTGSGPLVPVREAGDEPYLLSALTRAAVVCARRRALAARKAFELGASVLILDDGFQHLPLRRDLDILMLRSPKPWDGDLILPSGALREPPEAHRAADVIIALGDPPGPFLARLAGSRPLFRAKMAPLSFSELSSPLKLPLDYPKRAWRKPKILAFCGLANPISFYRALCDLDLAPSHRLTLADHAEYGPENLKKLRELSDRHRPDLLITTAKDAVKLGHYSPGRQAGLGAGMGAAFLAPPPAFPKALPEGSPGDLSSALREALAGDPSSAFPGDPPSAFPKARPKDLPSRPILVLESGLEIERGEELADLAASRLGLKRLPGLEKSPSGGPRFGESERAVEEDSA